MYFNPRAPYGARRCGGSAGTDTPGNFNPRAPYGARLVRAPRAGAAAAISIHAPHTGRDADGKSAIDVGQQFQSTRPIRGATKKHPPPIDNPNFNPRAPYGARRFAIWADLLHLQYFNPRAPYGARLLTGVLVVWLFRFQSTRPIRGATGTSFSLRVSREFQSTRPIRGATRSLNPFVPPKHMISIHAPHTGRDFALSLVYALLARKVFQSTRPIRGATSIRVSYAPPTAFQSTRPIRGATRRRTT